MYQSVFMVFHVDTFHDVSPMMWNLAVPQVYLCEIFPSSPGIPVVDQALALLWFGKIKQSVLVMFMYAQNINIKNTQISS